MQSTNWDTFQIELEFKSVGFRGRGKTGVPGEKPTRSKDENQQQTQPTYVTESGKRTLGSHWWEASALITAPSLLPFSKVFKFYFYCHLIRKEKKIFSE